MSSTGNTDLERLLNELVDDTLTEDDERYLADMLRANSSARRDYRRFMALHADLQWDYAAAVLSQPDTLPTAPAKQARTWMRVKWLVAAVVLFLAVFGSYVLTRLPPSGSDTGQAVIGRVVPVAGEVKLTEDGQDHVVTQEAELRSEDGILVVGLSGLAVLRLNDGTEISLAGETRISCRRHNDQTTLILHEGNLSAHVAPQEAGHPLQIRTSNAEISVLGTRLTVGAIDEVSELGVQKGLVQIKRLTDGETIDVSGGQYAVVSQRVSLEAKPWPKTPETWSEDFDDGLPDGWRYGQWLRDGETRSPRGVVRAARRFVLDGSESELHRITLPKEWMQGLWRLQEDTMLHFTYKMSPPGWFHIMMGVRSDDLNPAHIGNYEIQSSHWKKADSDAWQTVTVPFSAFRKNIRGTPYADLPPTSPRAGDVVYLLWFDTGDVDRGLVIDRIWVDRSSQPAEVSP